MRLLSKHASKSHKKNAGISYDSFYTAALDYFRSQLPEKAYTAVSAVYGKREKHFLADELFPQFLDSSRLIFLNKSYRHPPVFVIAETETKKISRLRYRAYSLDDAFSYRNRKLVYTAFEPDLRWGWRDYSVIRLIDLDSKKDIRLTKKTKYFSPDISLDGKSIVAVNLSQTGKSYLDILDAGTGEILKQIPNPEQLIYTYPKFFGENQLVVAARNAKGEMSLMQIDIHSGSRQILVDWSLDVLGYLSVEKSQVYFTRSIQGQDQGFCWRDGRVYRLLADAVTGNYQLSGSYENLTWNSFSSAGYRVRVAGGCRAVAYH
jgi:hypothetical protein